VFSNPNSFHPLSIERSQLLANLAHHPWRCFCLLTRGSLSSFTVKQPFPAPPPETAQTSGTPFVPPANKKKRFATHAGQQLATPTNAKHSDPCARLTGAELLRHANNSVTMNLYAQAVTDIKRSAQSKVARLVFKAEKDQGDEMCLVGPFRTGGEVGNFS
jgi:hypothetical protein